MQTSIRMLLLFSVLTGVIYPLAMTGIGQLLFRERANGGIVYVNGVIRGGDIIGQKFSSPRYFWGRPSAIDYHAECSGATNFSPTHAELKKSVLARQEAFGKTHNMSAYKDIPADMLLCSASGLDPHISPLAAQLQIERIVQARSLSPQQKQQLLQILQAHIIQPDWGFLGESRVNVLQINLALDRLCR